MNMKSALTHLPRYSYGKATADDGVVHLAGKVLGCPTILVGSGKILTLTHRGQYHQVGTQGASGYASRADGGRPARKMDATQR